MSNRIQTYRKLPANLKQVYSSDKTLKIQSGIITKYKIENENTYIDVIGDTILGFHKTSELPQLLQKEVGVSADDARHIFADLQEFLAPVIEREQKEEKPHKEELEKLQEVIATAGTAPPEHHTTVQPMRTMEADMDRIHGYGAYRAKFPEESKETEHKEEMIRSVSQEELLTEKPKLADMPAYEEGEK